MSNIQFKLRVSEGEFFKVKNYKNGKQFTMDYGKNYIDDLIYNGILIQEQKRKITIKKKGGAY